MKYKILGNTSLKVSKCCLGTMTFGQQNSEKESFEIIEDFTQISTLDSHSISGEVDEELSLMELIEFVRLSVQMIYDEFRSD